MTPDRRERLVEIMAAMATDPTAVFALVIDRRYLGRGLSGIDRKFPADNSDDLVGRVGVIQRPPQRSLRVS
jgi:hypothetical protein